MEFNLKNDLVFFDVETTGLNVLKDRILQIALIKYLPGAEEAKTLKMLINPGIPISAESIKVHGITPADVANKPTFRQVAKELYEFIGNADLAGYNSNRFDIPMLMEEFYRAGYDFEIEHRKLIDVQRLFYKMEPRTLKAAYRYYCGKEMEDAHDALVDVQATVEVLKGQIKMYENRDYVEDSGNVLKNPVRNDMQAIHDFTNDLRIIDVTQRLKYNDEGKIVFNFGKYLNQEVKDVLQRDKQYFHWIMDKDFSIQVKKTIKKIMQESNA
jgi:DNA polymerase-3 subunit epsilon